MTFSEIIIGDDEAVERLPFYVPRPSPLPIPEPNIFDEPLRCLIINAKWAAHFRGVIDALDQPDAWLGTEEEVEAARQQVREALVRFGNECMICCDDTNELLEAIKDLNQSIVNNQLTLITNNETLIENQYQQIIQQYTNTYNQTLTSSANAALYNSQIWDGTPQSMGSQVPDTTFSTDVDDTLPFQQDAREAALCAAIKEFIDYILYLHTTNVNLGSGLAAAAIVAGIALAPATLGISAAAGTAAGFVIGGITGLVYTAWQNAVNDPSAIRKVACCMYDGLKDAEITFENFKNAIQDCGFDEPSNESLIAANVYNEMQSETNFRAFLRSMSENYGVGNVAECICNCDDDIILSDYAGTGCVITPMGNCIYRFTQSTPIEDIYYYFSFKDDLNRCLLVEESPDPLMPTYGVGTGTSMTDCNDVYSEFVGGFGGELKQARWWNGYNGVTYYKITLAE